MMISNRTVIHCVLVWISVILTQEEALAIKITRMSVPRWVENGTVDSLILDCDYAYTDRDRNIVVKWFLNSDPEPIYQWITEYNTRHVSWRLQEHINMNYGIIPSNKMTKFRALNILRPTIELSGKYSCHVVSWASQDSAEKTMIVYAPPRQVSFNYTKTASRTANLSCKADGAFPLAEFHLSQITVHDTDWQPLTGVANSALKDDGTFGAEKYALIQDRTLPLLEPVEFQCVLSLPGTEFLVERRLIYYPDPPDVDSASTLRGHLTIVLLTVIVFVFLQGKTTV